MKNHMTDRFPEYLSGELDRAQKAEIEAHLHDCTVCREEYDTLLRLWARLDTLPDVQPGPDMRARFTAMLAAYEEGARGQRVRSTSPLDALDRFIARMWPKQPVMQFMLAAALFAVGMFGGIRIATPEDSANDIARLRTEVQSMGHLLALSMLNQQSASERIRGVGWTAQIDRPDPQVMTALVNALRYDPNVNVRLASTDALSRFITDPLVQERIIESMPDQTSPLVQIALVDLVVAEQISGSADVLAKMATATDLSPVVRQRIEAGIQELSSGETS